MMPRFDTTDALKLAFSAALSARALKVGNFVFRVFDQLGTRDQWARAARRSDSSSSCCDSKSSGTASVGAMFHEGTQSVELVAGRPPSR